MAINRSLSLVFLQTEVYPTAPLKQKPTIARVGKLLPLFLL